MAVESFVFSGRKVILSRETYNYDEIQDPPGETRQNWWLIATIHLVNAIVKSPDEDSITDFRFSEF